MYGKIQISAKLEIKTGMHIGGSDAFAAIGAVDAPVIRDSRTNLPMIPGSSLKGKLRTLLAKAYNEHVVSHDNDSARIKRLFGTSQKNENGRVEASRILVADMFVNKDALEELHRQGLSGMTEIKFENTINRLTAVANPRQIERVIPGVYFDLDIIYEMQDEMEAIEDFEMLAQGLKLLQYDYLGGHGSRGYGKIGLKDIRVSPVVGEVDDSITKDLNDILQECIIKAER